MYNIRRDGSKTATECRAPASGNSDGAIIGVQQRRTTKVDMLRLQRRVDGAQVHQLHWIDFVPARVENRLRQRLISKTLTDRLSKFRVIDREEVSEHVSVLDERILRAPQIAVSIEVTPVPAHTRSAAPMKGPSSRWRARALAVRISCWWSAYGRGRAGRHQGFDFFLRDQ